LLRSSVVVLSTLGVVEGSLFVSFLAQLEIMLIKKVKQKRRKRAVEKKKNTAKN
jgi:hypothetical protein